MVFQRKTAKKPPREGLRRSSRLKELDSRPRLDVQFEKLPQKSSPTMSQSINGTARNLETSSALRARKKSTNPRKSQGCRLTSRLNKLSEAKIVSLPADVRCDDQLKTSGRTSTKKCNDSIDDDDLNFLELFGKLCSVDDATVKPRRHKKYRKRISKCFKPTISRSKPDDAGRNVLESRKELDDTKRSFAENKNSEKTTTTGALQRTDTHRPHEHVKVKNLKEEKENINDTIHNSSIDELCSQFKMCEFASKGKCFIKEETFSLDDCLQNLRPKNFLTHKLNEHMKYAKFSNIDEQLPNLIPLANAPGNNAAPTTDSSCHNRPPKVANASHRLNVRKILKSITHVPSKVPTYEPYEEDWYEGFDSWRK